MESKNVPKRTKKRIVLPESEDERTYKAAKQILKEGFADLIIVGSEKQLRKTVRAIFRVH